MVWYCTHDREVAALGVLGDNAGGVYNRSGIVEAAMRYNASWASYTGYLLSCPTVSFDHSLCPSRIGVQRVNLSA